VRGPFHRLGDLQGKRKAPPGSQVLSSKEFADVYGADLGKALADTGKVTAVNFWQDRRWPELGDRWGIILEELINGTRTDVKGGLDELEAFAVELAKK
jgi:multiple sugar transport system substrate-binding protein